MCVCYIYNGGTLWLVIHRILLGHPNDTYDWLLIYTIYTMVDLCVYICIFTITTTDNKYNHQSNRQKQTFNS